MNISSKGYPQLVCVFVNVEKQQVLMIKKILKKLAILSLIGIFIFPNSVFAAIAFDNALNLGSSTTGTTLTVSFTVGSGSNRILFVGAVGNNTGSATDDITGATYNGVAMTLIDKTFVAADRYRYLFYLINPASGANNVVITSSTSDGFKAGSVASYTGASQTGQPDANGKNQDTNNTLTTTATVVASNSWTIMAGGVGGGTAVASTGSTLRDTATNIGMFDSNGIVSTGSHSMTIITSDSPTTHPIMGVMASFSPAAATSAPSITSDLILFGDW